VANLTLMALGSSAPEILLASIETAGTLGTAPGELGPSTIVGSAAFNLLAISAVCVASIPDGESRKIMDLGVFMVTATWSVLAYLWMLVVLQMWTPGVVTLAEAVITLLAFPVFVFHSYAQDRKWWRDSSNQGINHGDVHLVDLEVVPGDGRHRETLSGAETECTKHHSKEAREKAEMKEMLKMLKDGEPVQHNFMQQILQKSFNHGIFDDVKLDRFNEVNSSLAQFRRNARRMLAGRAFLAPMKDKAAAADPEEESSPKMTSSESFPAQSEDGIICFSAAEYKVMEDAGCVTIPIKRRGALHKVSIVKYHTADGTAVAGDKYQKSEGMVVFRPGETKKTISVNVVDNDIPEPDVNFLVHLSRPHKLLEGDVISEQDLKLPDGKMVDLVKKRDTEPDPSVVLGDLCMCQVVIMDDDEPGVLAFTERNIKCTSMDKVVTVSVSRTLGASGQVGVEYSTTDGSAVNGEDFEATSGMLTFEAGEMTRSFEVPLKAVEMPETTRVFHVHLRNPVGKAHLSKGNVATVRIVEDGSMQELTNEVQALLAKKKALLMLHTQSWRAQFRDALLPGAGVDEDGNETEPGGAEYFLHFLTFGWKVLFAFVPPTNFCNGWVTFYVSLVFIGVLTAVVGELASLFGCGVDLKDSVTAITFVALGTSLPDTFASRQAAVQMPTADASIGNVTGSNTVNVLLGLGLPWIMGSIYYAFNGSETDNKYCVPSGVLGYSVLVFTLCALLCLSLLMYRRSYCGGELGGNAATKKNHASILVCLWIGYILLSSLQSYGHIEYGKEVHLDNYGCDCSESWSTGVGCPVV